MKKLMIPMTALIVIFAVVGAYACGNHEKADMNSSKAEINDTGAQMTSNPGTDDGFCVAASKEAKAMTTEAHEGPSGIKTQKAGCCVSPSSAPAKNTSAKTDKASMVQKSEAKPTLAVTAPVDLSTTNQK
jgi:hypothetical protein